VRARSCRACERAARSTASARASTARTAGPSRPPSASSARRAVGGSRGDAVASHRRGRDRGLVASRSVECRRGERRPVGLRPVGLRPGRTPARRTPVPRPGRRALAAARRRAHRRIASCARATSAAGTGAAAASGWSRRRRARATVREAAVGRQPSRAARRTGVLSSTGGAGVGSRRRRTLRGRTGPRSRGRRSPRSDGTGQRGAGDAGRCGGEPAFAGAANGQVARERAAAAACCAERPAGGGGLGAQAAGEAQPAADGALGAEAVDVDAGVRGAESGGATDALGEAGGGPRHVEVDDHGCAAEVEPFGQAVGGDEKVDALDGGDGRCAGGTRANRARRASRESGPEAMRPPPAVSRPAWPSGARARKTARAVSANWVNATTRARGGRRGAGAARRREPGRWAVPSRGGEGPVERGGVEVEGRGEGCPHPTPGHRPGRARAGARRRGRPSGRGSGGRDGCRQRARGRGQPRVRGVGGWRRAVRRRWTSRAGRG
jgi:hypothetical protein